MVQFGPVRPVRFLVEHHANKFALCQPLAGHPRLSVKIQRNARFWIFAAFTAGTGILRAFAA